MRMRGLEPPRPERHTDLNRARLPIPPHPRAADSSPDLSSGAGVASRPARQAAPRPGGPHFFGLLEGPPGRCAPRGEEVEQAPGLPDSLPARPDDPDGRLAITPDE